jgi:hypothetical protein
LTGEQESLKGERAPSKSKEGLRQNELDPKSNCEAQFIFSTHKSSLAVKL